MFDLSWSHMAIFVVVALLVLGPKELPNAIRTGAQLLRSARKLAGEFRSGVDELIREAELDDTRRSIQEAMSEGIGNTIGKHVDPTGEIKSAFDADEIKASLSDESTPGNLISHDPSPAPPHSLPPTEEASPEEVPALAEEAAPPSLSAEERPAAEAEAPEAPAVEPDADLKKKSA